MAAGYRLIAILGPTASGKSSLAMELCQRLGGELLSLDSMQVYRGMDIGTAKPTPGEQQLVRHHLIDVVDATEPFTVARFVEMADEVIAHAKRRDVPLIAAGGTPLYYKSLFEGLFEGPSADEALRNRLRQISGDELHVKLKQVDPAAADRIHPNDQKRLIRALEVFELTGKPITSFHGDWGGQVRHKAQWFGLNWDREMLNQRINARVKQMMAAGWLDEVKRLPKPLSPTAGEATGYAELLAHLEGRMTLDDAVEQIKIATRQLARRQMKWMRRFPHVTWLAGDHDVTQLANRVIQEK